MIERGWLSCACTYNKTESDYVTNPIHDVIAEALYTYMYMYILCICTVLVKCLVCTLTSMCNAHACMPAIIILHNLCPHTV